MRVCQEWIIMVENQNVWCIVETMVLLSTTLGTFVITSIINPFGYDIIGLIIFSTGMSLFVFLLVLIILLCATQYKADFGV